ncbi:histidine kinase [Actinokineospora sp. NBRC 105648]|uniref:sensor histidine kinase n=1 Tax=Actinokineospora sp. NBRC 105648 TaxID=3032206 RepID=UPI0024A16120|nr:histidine kinase [Actinokineospora sp. NBRC 105648]GLZ36656.1 histidine kinase [Actinokineospora sp. NBRC 105648]
MAESWPGRPLRFLRSGRPWRSLWYVAVGAVAALPVLALAKWALARDTPASYGLGAVAVVAVNLVLAVPLASAERRRLALVDRGRSPRAPLERGWLWRKFGYALVFTVVIAVADLVVLVVALSALVVPLSPLLEFVLDIDSMVNFDGPVGAPSAVLAGALLLPAVAFLVSLFADAQAVFARTMLTRPDTSLPDRVAELTRSRTRLVDAFETERRRIERDLHDGAQQRLVALAMTLGMAELDLAGVPGAGPGLVARARAEAYAVLAELRELVHGIHPRVLIDRGIEAGVTELAERSPIAVRVRIDPVRRSSPEVEAVAYFVVSEALANVAKHSGAGQVEVTGSLTGSRLVLRVADDGAGGADPRRGTGLQGLADRVSVVGGVLALTSPPGGPTELRVELPWDCA